MTLTYDSPRQDTIARIREAVEALGGAVYSVTDGGRRDGLAQRWRRIEFCIAPATDAYIFHGARASGVSTSEALAAALAAAV